MTIDERLGALTQTVELLGHMQIETEKRMATLADAQTKTETTLNRLEKTVNRMGRYAMVIARDHEVRLAALESDEPDLDE